MLSVIFGSAVAILIGEYIIDSRRKARELARVKGRLSKINKDLETLKNELKGWKK